MFKDDLSKVSRLEIAINILSHAAQKLHEHDCNSAQVLVLAARHMLEELQIDLDDHFHVENMLQQLLS